MKKLLLIATLVSFTFIAEAQYRNGNDRVYTQNDRHFNNSRADRGRAGTLDSYQRDARARIAQGIVEGTITSREAAKLLEMAEQIERKENKYKRSGGLSSREVAELQNDLKLLDRRILKERKDRDKQSNDDFRRSRN